MKIRESTRPFEGTGFPSIHNRKKSVDTLAPPVPLPLVCMLLNLKKNISLANENPYDYATQDIFRFSFRV